MLKKSLFIIILVFVFSNLLDARPGAAWLEIGPGGRAAGLAEAVTASVEGPSSSYWNPAAVGSDGGGAEVMLGEWIAGTHTQFVSADKNVGKWGLGLSVIHVGVGDLELRDRPSSSPIGSFEARSYAIGASVARILPLAEIKMGVTGRYLSDAIYDENAKGWSVDVGFLRSGLFAGKLDLGASVRHIGDMEALDEESYDLPTTYSFGGRWHFGTYGKFIPSIMVDGVQVIDQDFSIRGATEIGITDLLAIRGGYATGYEARGLSAGFGLHWKSWRFDYGYSPFSEDLGYTQRISLSTKW